MPRSHGSSTPRARSAEPHPTPALRAGPRPSLSRKDKKIMAGMYEIVGFDELVGGSFPPHSTQGYRYPYHPHMAAGDLVAGLIAGDDEAAGDAMLTGLDAPNPLPGADPPQPPLNPAG